MHVKSMLGRAVAATGATLMLAAPAVIGSPAGADHSWGGYHWARTANPFSLALGDNVDTTWDSHLGITAADWSASSVLDTIKVPGQVSPKTCKGTNGRVEVCNARYGSNGWLGLASVWVSGSHITKGTVKLNDTYFNTAKYNSPAWRNLVMCQEVGHTLGLGHNDEDFSTTNGTCMDYSNDPVPNQHPDAHDYAQLEGIYSHLDWTTTLGPSTGSSRAAQGGDSAAEWGRAIRTSADGRPSLYERDLGGGHRVFTFVFWAEAARGH